MIPMYNKKGFVGYCLINPNLDGEPEMTGFTPKAKDPLGALKSILEEIFSSGKIIESEYAEGFEVTAYGEKWTAYTVYLKDQARFPGQYTLYEALPDMRKGIDIEDEKEICSGDLNAIQMKLSEYEL